MGTSSDPDFVHETTYTYENAGRLGTVAYQQNGSTSKTFTYGYQDESFGLVETIVGPVHDVTRHWEDHRNVLESIRSHNKADTADFSKYVYDVNKLGQREDVDRSGDAFSAPVTVAWGYNDRGELVTENHPTAARDNVYAYDAIGNRTESASGTLTLSGANYTTNDQNQYTATPASPTVNSVDFDDDGNLEDDGDKFLYEWDAENRLVALQTRSGVTPERRYEMKYDYMGRCYQKEELKPDGVDDWEVVTTSYFVYDGWNRIEETSSSGSYHVEFCWGLDLSGSFQGAGGVGGLLLRNDTMNGTAGTPTYRMSYPTYDGNGNVSEYLDSTGAVVTHFEYDAFGKTIYKTDTSSNTGWFKLGTLDGVHRFSTKPRQSESELYYYGYRYYDPVTGRWPSRDPIGEEGGINLYGMVGNDTVGKWDKLGLLLPGHPGDWGPVELPFEPNPFYPNGGWHPPMIPPTPSKGNCARYACNDPAKNGEPHDIFPGEHPEVDHEKKTITWTCEKIMAALLEKDGVEKPDDSGECPCGFYKIKGVVRSEHKKVPDNSPKFAGYTYNDFHFYRQNDDGSWSDKPGTLPVDPSIKDPDADAKKNGYDIPCGVLCVKEGGIDLDKKK